MPADQESARDQAGRWKPGVSGNPTGRTPGSGIITALRAAITVERAAAIADRAVALAEDGDPRLLDLILDRLDGPVRREVEISGALSLGAAAAILAEVPIVEDDGAPSE